MWLLCLATAFAADPITWENVTTEARLAWEAGPGAGVQQQIDAAHRAAGAVPFGPTAFNAEAQLGWSQQLQITTTLEIPLDLGVSERQSWSALADARAAQGEASRWAWTQTVQRAWLDWWTATEVAAHLDEYAAEVQHELDGFQDAVDEGLLAILTLEDLNAEAIQIRAEAATMEQTAAVAAARVRTLLGDRPLDAGGHDLHEFPLDAVNPWAGAALLAAAHPAVREAEATARAERARATALRATRLPTLEAGPMWAPKSDGSLRTFAFVGVNVPLQPGVGSATRDARGAADAADADRAWLEQSIAAHLEEERLSWDAARLRLERLEDEVLGPLVVRQERLETAFAEGLVTSDRLVRARRERHEAEHQIVLAAGELLASEARAQAVRALLEESR